MSLRISVLGTEYEISYDLQSSDADGETNTIAKRIQITPLERMLDGEATQEEREKWMAHVKRHELVHAYFCEAGLMDYCTDETLVDWIAAMWPRMTETFEVMGCASHL